MTKLTKILMGVTLATWCGAGGGMMARADLQYVLTPWGPAKAGADYSSVWQDYMLSVRDTTPGITTAAFFSGGGQLNATGFTFNSNWEFYSISLIPPFSKSTGSVIPPNLNTPNSDTHSSAFGNGQLLKFVAPESGAGIGLEFDPVLGVQLGYFTLYYEATSAPPSVQFFPTYAPDEVPSHFWTETSGSTTVNRTDKNGGVVSSMIMPGQYQNIYVGAGETRHVNKTQLDIYNSNEISFQIHPEGKVVWTEDPGVPRQSAENVYVVDGSRLLLFGQFDITNHDLIIRNSTFEEVQNWITTGKVITSKAGTAVGYARVEDLGLDSFDTVAVGVTDILIKDTYAGDADLDGKITTVDFAQIDAAFLSGDFAWGGAQWINGDCNHDGFIDLTDFALMDAAFTLYSQTNGYAALARAQADAARFGSAFTAIYDAALASAIPEPGSLGVLVLGVGCLMKRRRR